MRRLSARSVSPGAVLWSALLWSLLLLPAMAGAQSAPLYAPPQTVQGALDSSAPPLRIAEGFGVEPLAVLPSAAEGAGDQIAAVRSWNLQGNRPQRTGFTRPLPEAQRVRLNAALLAEPAGVHDGGAFARSSALATVWGTEVRVERAWRLRLHLEDVVLPAAARLWVYGETGEAVGPLSVGQLRGPDGDLWTPSVEGPTIRLELEIPDSALAVRSGPGFVIDRVAELVRLDARGEPLVGNVTAALDLSCIEEAACFDSTTFETIDLVERGIAQLQFIEGPFIFVCSGGLLNDTLSSGTPFLLTANHCISAQREAATLEAFWDYGADSCGGPVPALNTRPRSVGSSLLSTSVSSDHTLLELDNLPGNRVFLGWQANLAAVTPTTPLHRISHPVPEGEILPQSYSQFRLRQDFLRCGPDDDGRPWDDPEHFIHSTQQIGGDFGGSSGAPLILGNGQVVGQLLGACGPDPAEGCDARNDSVDGAFAETFRFISGFLTGQGGVPDPPDGPWLTTAELPGFRFKVRITAGGEEFPGAPEACIPETLCVSGALAGRTEAFVRIVGPRPNGYLWPIVVKFTSSQVEVWIEQLSTGELQYYRLEEAGPGLDTLDGLFDRTGFLP